MLKKCPKCELEEIKVEKDEVTSKSGFFDPRNVVPEKPEVIINCKKCGKFPWTLEDETCQK